ncbi:ABC transporter permease subunit [Actinoplanes sp. CA-051413]|uniref:ABC transporter permease subunit n=1 Tax=Actinoplanes sp. CA-051413 TaxID=3239899 RepID=UPI003D99E8ED
MRAVLHAEWTKLRTVRGWVVALAVAAAAVVGLGLLTGGQGSCGRNGPQSECVLPVGPGGQEVTDHFTFVHRSLTGDGSITVRLNGLTGVLPRKPGLGGPPDGAGPQVAEGGPGDGQPGLAPWAKGGLIIKDGTRPGSTYAAIMLTGAHGVRMQHDYVHDRAGPPAPATTPRWLRLTRAGQTITGEESPDGTAWTTVGTVRLPGLPATAQVGTFATSPQFTWILGGGRGVGGAMGGPSEVTATFDNLAGRDTGSDASWSRTVVGGDAPPQPEQLGASLRVTGSGDIAPAVSGISGIGTTVSQTLAGTFAGLILVVVVATMTMTAEYRRGMIRTTVAAVPRRGRILLAKATIIGAVTFGLGVLAATVVIVVGRRVLLANGVYLHPAATGTEVRLVVGTGLLLAGAAVLALGLGALLRRGLTAVVAGIVVIVLPYLLAMTVLPPEPAKWLLRVTPAAAFAVQQSAVSYPQVDDFPIPVNGYFPLPPWAGLAVLAGWAALVLGLAGFSLRRRDV